MLLHYESTDSLTTGWHFTGVLYTGAKSNRLECPSYAVLSGSPSPAFLTYSWPVSYAQFWVRGSELANGSFVPSQSSQLEYGIGYAAEMTSTWPGRLLLFSWLRGVNDRAVYIGAQSLPREIRLLPDVTVQAAPELEALIDTSSINTANLTVGPTAPELPLPRAVPQQARIRVQADATGAGFPGSFGLALLNNATSAQLRLSITVDKGSACVSLDARQGCVKVKPPSMSSETAWLLHTTAEVWLDNGLIEVFVGNGSASLSAFYPKLYNVAAGLSGAVWSEKGVSAKVGVEWSSVASAAFEDHAGRA